MVFKADTVVDPGAMMVHEHHTSPANGAVMCTRWLYFVTGLTFFGPKVLELFGCFTAIAQ